MRHARAGAAIVMVLVAVSIASLLIASQLSMIVARERAARQLRAKAQAQWLAESALDRARLERPQSDKPDQVWRPDVSGSNLPTHDATIRWETDSASRGTLVVVARVGKQGSPAAAQHTLRELLSPETEP